MVGVIFQRGHFSTCQTCKKSTPVTFFLHMRHVFLRPGVISLRLKMTPRSIFDGGRYSSLHRLIRVTATVSWKNGCQNVSYVHRSRKHWKSKYKKNMAFSLWTSCIVSRLLLVFSALPFVIWFRQAWEVIFIFTSDSVKFVEKYRINGDNEIIVISFYMCLKSRF